MRLSRACAGLLGLVFVMVCASPASAQGDRRVELSGGYQLLHAAGDLDETFGLGWYADLSANMARGLDAVFQVGGNYKTLEETVTVQGVSTRVEANIKVHEFLGGVRTSIRATPAITPFAQVLLGGLNGSADVSGSVTSGSNTIFATSGSDSSTNFAMQFGGGVNVRLNDRIGVRVGVDYLRVFADDEDLDGIRVALGAVFPF